MLYLYNNISLIDDMLKMVNDKLELKAKLFRGFGDVTRLAILESVSDGENTVTEIADKLRQSQPNVSNHLSCLLECGLVNSRKDGKNKFYSIGDKRVSKILKQGDDILEDIAEGIHSCVNYKK